MAYVLALSAALSSACAGVLQRIGVESAPEGATMRLSLLTHALRRKVWLAGFALLLTTFVLQAMALRFGDLAVVQPVMTTELLFLIIILATHFHRQLGWREWIGAAAIVAGLAGFLAMAAPSTGRGLPSGRDWWVVGGITVVAAAALVFGGQRGPRWWRAAALGAAAASLFGLNAAIVKSTTTLITEGWSHVFDHWEPYGLAVVGATGFFLLQSSLHAGPIASSRATMVIVNPLVAVAIGATIFNESLRGGLFVLGEVAGLAVMCAGCVVLVRSPLVAGVGSVGAGELLGVLEGPIGA